MIRFLILTILVFLPSRGEGEDTGRRRIRFDPDHFGVLYTLYPEVGRVQSVDVSSDGRILACGGPLGEVSLFQTRSWSPSGKHVLPVGNISSIAFAPGSSRFAVCGLSSNRIYLLDAEKEESPRVLQGREKAFYDLVWFPDGRRLLSSGDNGAVHIWDVKTGRTERVLRGHQGSVSALALNRKGTVLCTAGQDGLIRMYETEGWEEVSVIRSPGMRIRSLTLGSEGKVFFAGRSGPRPKLCSWDASSGTRVSSSNFFAGTEISDLQVDTSGRYLFASVGADLKVFHQATLAEVKTFSYHRSPIRTLAQSSQRRWVISGGDGSHVVVWGFVPGGMAALAARGFFGVRVQDAGQNLGASVVEVIPDTAASRAGIQVNDIISRVGSFDVQNMATAIAAIGIHSAGTKVSFTILREEKKVSLTVALGERPEDSDP